MESEEGYDQLILFLEDAFLIEQTSRLNEILVYLKEFVVQLSFKSKPSR